MLEGILVYVAETLLPKWTSMTATSRLVEASVLKALASTMQASATNGNFEGLELRQATVSLLAKLCMGCIAFYDKAPLA